MRERDIFVKSCHKNKLNSGQITMGYAKKKHTTTARIDGFFLKETKMKSLCFIYISFIVSLFTFSYAAAGPPAPVSLEHIATIDVLPDWNHCKALACSGNVLFVGVNLTGGPERHPPGALLTYDISNPAIPLALGRLDVTGVINDIKLVGEFAYVSNDELGLKVVDALDPYNLYLVGSYDEYSGPASSAFLGLDVLGDYVYVTDHWQGLKIIDISDPSLPALRSTKDLSYFEHDVKVCWPIAYIHTSHRPWGALFDSIDVTNPDNPIIIQSISLPLSPGLHVLSSGCDYAYIAAHEGGLQIVSITDPSNMQLISSYPLLSAWSVDVKDNYVFVIDQNEGLVIVDVSDPYNPVHVYSYPTEASRVEVSEDLVFVSTGTEGKVLILELASPAEQIQEILDFVYDSVIVGTIVGVGSGKSAENKLNAFINMLEEARSLIEAELFCQACLQLQDIYKKCDGQSSPPDSVAGPAAIELAERIENLMESLSCAPAPDLGFMDHFVDAWPDTCSQNGIWMKEGPWEIDELNTYLRQENVSVSDSKLVLTVPANECEGAQIKSLSHDFHYGYYEARIKASAEPGVVNAFFMYRPTGNYNEIDIEFLSNEFSIGAGKVRFALHPYDGQPHDAEVDLPFNPADSFNEYAFSWSASCVDFFVNDQLVASMPASEGYPVPSRPGALIISNWTGGLVNWGGGPPSNSTTMEVDWVSFTPEVD